MQSKQVQETIGLLNKAIPFRMSSTHERDLSPQTYDPKTPSVEMIRIPILFQPNEEDGTVHMFFRSLSHWETRGLKLEPQDIDILCDSLVGVADALAGTKTAKERESFMAKAGKLLQDAIARAGVNNAKTMILEAVIPNMLKRGNLLYMSLDVNDTQGWEHRPPSEVLTPEKFLEVYMDPRILNTMSQRLDRFKVLEIDAAKYLAALRAPIGHYERDLKKLGYKV